MKKTVLKMLNELRSYIIIWFCLYVILFIICFLNKEFIYRYIINDIHVFFNTDKTNIFVYTSIFESFTTDIILSLYSSFFLSLPIIYTIVYRFIAKSLYTREKKIILPMFIISFILVLIAILLTNQIVFPYMVNFLISNATIAQPMLKISECIATFFHVTIIVSLIFQFPIVLICLKKFGFIDENYLSQKRKFSIVIIFILSAIITPPDVISQILVASCLITIYEITNIILKKI